MTSPGERLRRSRYSPSALSSRPSPTADDSLSLSLLLCLTLSKPIFRFLSFTYGHNKEDRRLHLRLHGWLEGTQRVLKRRDPGRWGAMLRHQQRRATRGREASWGPLPLIWSSTALPQRINPVLRTPNHNKGDLDGDERWLARKWPEHNVGAYSVFKWSFLSPRSSPRLEISTYQLVSLRRSIWYIYIYCLYLVLFVKNYIFRDKLCKLSI